LDYIGASTVIITKDTKITLGFMITVFTLIATVTVYGMKVISTKDYVDEKVLFIKGHFDDKDKVTDERLTHIKDRVDDIYRHIIFLTKKDN
jgi:hypothetical protein